MPVSRKERLKPQFSDRRQNLADHRYGVKDYFPIFIRHKVSDSDMKADDRPDPRTKEDAIRFAADMIARWCNDDPQYGEDWDESLLAARIWDLYAQQHIS